MYAMKNGILYRNENPVFCIGLSYYPSYHERKVPVPENGDRVKEMKKDLQAMKDAGFNLVRMAAIGSVGIENNGICIHTEFIDSILDEADKIGIATMVRLQGYSMNLSGYKDFYMIDSDGKQMNPEVWYDFIQNSLHHSGICRDNDLGTAALAEHYSKYKNLVSYQTYNEPHYPSGATYDYHPAAIREYRKWLVAIGAIREDEAENYMPPTSRPQKGEDAKAWILWRMFSIKSLSDFLNHTADVAKKVHPRAESLTCLTTCQTLNWNTERCVNYFDNAESMDVVGVTHYINTYGAPYFHACLVLDSAESAAAIYGKHCWIVEYDARTTITLRKFYEETYMAVGAGVKGIMYYQWRGDYVFPDSPEGNGFGLINYDGTPTEYYKEKLDMVNLLNELSDYIVNADKKRCGVGILYSRYAFCHSDAIDNDERAKRNLWLDELKRIYIDLRKEGLTVDTVESRHLKKNTLDIKVLYIPMYDLLSDDEKEEIDAFVKSGGRVYCSECSLEYRDITEKYSGYVSPYSIEDTILREKLTPVFSCSSKSIMVQVLEGDGYYLAAVNNISGVEECRTNIELDLGNVSARKVVMYTPQQKNELKKKGNIVLIPQLKWGAFLLIQE